MMLRPALHPDAQLMEHAQAVKGRSLLADARRRLFRNKAAVAGMVILALIALTAVFAPLLSLYGARVSLAVGVVATFVSLLIGVLYGAASGFIGGRVDAIMMRIVDVLYSLPFIFFVIILMVTFNQNFILLFVAIGAVSWLTMARIVRGQTLSTKQKEFVEAARAAGVGTFGIIRRHIVPNVVGPVIVYVTLTIPGVILAESFLSFLGLGIREPFTSWGVLISEGAGQMETAPWTLIFPATLMALTLFCFNFIGDGLRDALDPKDR